MKENDQKKIYKSILELSKTIPVAGQIVGLLDGLHQIWFEEDSSEVAKAYPLAATLLSLFAPVFEISLIRSGITITLCATKV